MRYSNFTQNTEDEAQWWHDWRDLTDAFASMCFLWLLC